MEPRHFEEFRTGSVSRAVLLIRNEFIADPDPSFYLNANPHPDSESQTIRSNADPDPGTKPI
jgi:hypothetical protein